MTRLINPKSIVCAVASLLCSGLNGVAASNPAASPEATVRSGNARFTVLTPQMIRIEYSDNGLFEDRATFTVQDRSFAPVPKFTAREDSAFLYIDTDRLALKYRKGSNPVTVPASNRNLTVSMQLDDQPVVWHPGMQDPLNLKGTCRTLDGSNGDNKRREMEQGPVSRSGWAVIDDSYSNVRPDGSRSLALVPNDTVGYQWWAPRRDPKAVDLYFMGYGHDYRRAVGDYTRLAGRIPMPPAYVFGYWYSKYASYSADDFRQIMKDLADNRIPADVMILDMDWHWNGNEDCQSKGRGGWTGWSWNTNLIPDAKALLSDIHGRGLKAALNLHPADGVNVVESPEYYRAMRQDLGRKYLKDGANDWSDIDWALDYTDFTKSFFGNVIRDHEREGVDFWWLDWQQHLTSDYNRDLGETFWCNHVFYNDMARNRPDRRPVIFHRWGGLGSHRYQIGFSGDAFINYPTLAFQTYFTPTASNVGYAYWGHDLGGHLISDEIAPNDSELVLRWLQFGVFTPILRTHATKDERIERRIWKFDNFPLMRQAVELRYSLFPYIYTAARRTYDTGIGMCRPMYYDWPEADEAYTHEGQYMFGDDILAAPVTAPAADGRQSAKTVWLPEGNWWSVAENQLVSGPVEHTVNVGLDQIPYFYRAGAVIPTGVDPVMSVLTPHKTIALNAAAHTDAEGSLYEDRGDNADYAESFATTRFTVRTSPAADTLTIEARQGDSAGLPAERAWQLRLYAADRPKSVTVNGRKVSKKSWAFNAADGILTVSLPSAPCNRSQTVTVTY